MKIAIDAREAVVKHRAGKGQWTLGFIEELLTRNHEIFLIGNGEENPKWNSSNCKWIHLPAGPLWHLRVIFFLRANKISTYISPTSFIVPFLSPKALRCFPVVHDTIALQKDPHNAKARIIEKLTLKKALKKSTAVFTVSNSTKSDVLEYFPSVSSQKIVPIYSGTFSKNPDKNVASSKTILSLGTLCPRKNQLRLIRAYDMLPEPFRSEYLLILAGGKGWKSDPIIELAKKTKGVTHLGYVSDAEYEQLLHTCAVLAYPSLYEGFGLQVLDAMQRGTLIVTTNRGSLIEVAKTCSVSVDPENVLDISKGIVEILTNTELQTAIRSEGPKKAAEYNWQRTVDLALEIVQNTNL